MDTRLSHTNHFALLDGLRGIAAIVVLSFHTILLVYQGFSFPHTYLTVNFFFVLSGFVMANAYEKKLLKTMPFKRFITIRLIRLYPMIFIAVTLGVFVLLIRVLTTHTLTYHELLIDGISGFTLLPFSTIGHELSQVQLFPVDGPIWTLFFEVLVNIAYASCVRWLSTPRVWCICVLSAIALMCISVINDGVDVGFVAAEFFLGTVRVTFSFFSGVLVYRYKPTLPKGNSTSIMLIILLLIILFPTFTSGTWLYDIFAAIFVLPLIIYTGVACRVTSALGRTYLALGELSYPLYIIHEPMNLITVHAFKAMHINFPLWFVAGFCVLVSALTAAMLLKFWDQPIRKWLTASLKERGDKRIGDPSKLVADSAAPGR